MGLSIMAMEPYSSGALASLIRWVWEINIGMMIHPLYSSNCFEKTENKKETTEFHSLGILFKKGWVQRNLGYV